MHDLFGVYGYVSKELILECIHGHWLHNKHNPDQASHQEGKVDEVLGVDRLNEGLVDLGNRYYVFEQCLQG